MATLSTLYPKIDPDGLLEYSVVFSDRSINHMSLAFQDTMRGLNEGLTSVYNASSCVLIPGGGTFGMEAVARQFAKNKNSCVT